MRERAQDTDDILKEILSGETYCSIAEKYNCSRKRVAGIAHRHGLAQRKVKTDTSNFTPGFKMRFDKEWRKAVKAIMGAVLILAMPAAAQTTKYVNSTNGLNLRKTCSTKDDILAVMDYGESVREDFTIGIGSAVWSQLQYNGMTGYALTEYLSEEDPLEGREYMGLWRITAYAETGYCCANGNYPRTGYTVACNALPFGTQVYIAGVGVRTVEDRGPQSMGPEWIDLYLGDYNTCVQWGNQYRDVWVIKE